MTFGDHLPHDVETLQALIREKDSVILEVNDQLQKTSSKLQKANIRVQNTDRQLKQANIRVQETDGKLEKANIRVQEAEQEITKLQESNTALERLNKLLEEKLRLQRARRFGKSSEKLPPDTFQLVMEGLEIDIAEAREEDAAEQAKQDPKKKKPKRAQAKRKHTPLPGHLPRVVKVLEPENKLCSCGKCMKPIGMDSSEQLAWRCPWYILETRRPIYACSCGKGGVRQALMSESLIPQSKATESALAHFVVSKFEDHLPLYRQSRMMAREGIHIPPKTLYDWTGKVAFSLRCVYDELKANLLASSHLFMDETRLPVLDPGRGQTKTGYLWAVARDERPYQGAAPPGMFYSYAPGRGTDHAGDILGRYSGYLQVDGYHAYPAHVIRRVEKGEPPPTLVYCWAHVRRKFHDLIKSGTPSPIADEALKRIGQLYGIEKDIRGVDAKTRRKVRQERSKPLVDAFWEWAETQAAKVSSKSSLGKAFKYMLALRNGLSLFLNDGCLEMDNNIVENTIRPTVLTRKNSLFAGNDVGGHKWAMIASMLMTARMNGLDPEKWLEKTLIEIANWRSPRNVHLLLPFRQEDLERLEPTIGS